MKLIGSELRGALQLPAKDSSSWRRARVVNGRAAMRTGRSAMHESRGQGPTTRPWIGNASG